ncbi:hypothetical protein AHMF7616_02427 [Adhaeribacter pallidiroseus]|uniref:Uncharacterized protein n=1 Tax=Adhaeribacter pallidiroseus TaxID=2072847 RepID=A0A369QNM1_9BACT|nr:hypothetical protein AHMF7616_02427 [Adhaeribacter pallidiroseus]
MADCLLLDKEILVQEYFNFNQAVQLIFRHITKSKRWIQF